MVFNKPAPITLIGLSIFAGDTLPILGILGRFQKREFHYIGLGALPREEKTIMQPES